MCPPLTGRRLDAMNDLRTALVAFVAVVVGFVGAWLVLGSRMGRLEDENRQLRAQTTQTTGSVQQRDTTQPALSEERLVGSWATTVERSAQGRTELILRMREDGAVIWESRSGGRRREIARGNWRLEDNALHFAVTITDDASAEQDREKTATAVVSELGGNYLMLLVDGKDWSFRRAS